MLEGTDDRSAILKVFPLSPVTEANDVMVALTFSGNFHIAPVAGSTIRIPIGPPKSIFPKYQPSMSAVSGMVCVATPFFVYSIY